MRGWSIQVIDLDILALDEALNNLAQVNSNNAKSLSCGFFQGLSIEDIRTFRSFSRNREA